MSLVDNARTIATSRQALDDFDETADLLLALADEIEHLQAALKKHGRHSLDDRCCAVYKCRGLTCDCGWGDVLKTLEEQAT